MLKGVFNGGGTIIIIFKIIDEHFFQKLSKEKLKTLSLKEGF